MKKQIILFALVFIIGLANAADWKYVGRSIIKGEMYDAFYDRLTVQKSKGKYISLWVKLIKSSEVDTIISQNSDSVTQLVAKKIAFYYTPPFVLALTDTSDYLGKAIEVTHLEVVVNKFDTKTRLKIHYELDVKLKKYRMLSYISYDNNEESVESSSVVGKWEDVAPETFSEVMLKVLSR